MVPMVSFCDIPIQASREHRQAYGRYVVGLSKAWGNANGLTPLLYLSESSPLTKSLTKHGRAITKTKLSVKDFGDVWDLLPYFKPVLGAFPDGCVGGRDYTGIKEFDQEMEWRYVPPANIGDIFSTALYEASTRDRIAPLNAKTEAAKLKFSTSDVERVVVSTPRQKRELARLHPELRAKIRTWKEVPLS